jgi:hypothetical protein
VYRRRKRLQTEKDKIINTSLLMRKRLEETLISVLVKLRTLKKFKSKRKSLKTLNSNLISSGT